MNMFAKMATAAIVTFTASNIALAASSPTVIKVSLVGEADQPMAIKLDKPAGKVGTYVFDVSNDAMGTDHEVVLVKISKKGQEIMADPKKHRIDESKLDSLGEVAGLKPGDQGKLKVKLAAGDYVLLCNHKSHYELGMTTPFSVTN
jgi:uncharacterized cupredoxin-like copper-binding protein